MAAEDSEPAMPILFEERASEATAEVRR